MAKLRVETFNERFRPDRGAAGPFLGWARKDTLRLFDCEPALFTDFMASQARSSYEEGAFRFLGPATDPAIFAWNGADGWQANWPAIDGALVVFAYDWMGRLYALDSSRVIQREPLVGRLDPGDGRIRQADLTFAEFVLGDLIAYGDRLLDLDRFGYWKAAGGAALRDTDVVGYIAPLFNAGTDTIMNMEAVALDPNDERMGRAFAARRGFARAEPARSGGPVRPVLERLGLR